jgi:hypothetical protein
MCDFGYAADSLFSQRGSRDTGNDGALLRPGVAACCASRGGGDEGCVLYMCGAGRGGGDEGCGWRWLLRVARLLWLTRAISDRAVHVLSLFALRSLVACGVRCGPQAMRDDLEDIAMGQDERLRKVMRQLMGQGPSLVCVALFDS